MKIIVLTALVAAITVGVASAQEAVQKAGKVNSITLPAVVVELKEGEGRVKTESYCTICHSADYITMQPKFSKAQWTATVNKMVKTYGAPIGQEEAETIIRYLSISYGTGN